MAPSKAAMKKAAKEKEAAEAKVREDVEAEVTRLKSILGRVEIEDEMAKASHVQIMLGYTVRDDITSEALDTLIGHNDAKWASIDLYRTFRQFPSYFVDGQVIDQTTINELLIVAQLWFSLDLERGLGRLLLPDKVFATKARLDSGKGSATELFREFIRHHKWQNIIGLWDCTSVFGLSEEVYKVVQEFYRVKSEPASDLTGATGMFPSPNSTYCSLISQQIRTLKERSLLHALQERVLCRGVSLKKWRPRSMALQRKDLLTLKVCFSVDHSTKTPL